MNIGEKIKQKRKELNLTQEEIAEKVHVSRQTISSWENSKSLPDVTSLILLSDVYQVSLDELIKGDSIMMTKIEETEQLARESIGLKRRRLLTELCLTGAVLFYILERLATINTHSAIIILIVLALLSSSIPVHLLTKKTNENTLELKSFLTKKTALLSLGVVIGFLVAFFISQFL